MSGLPVEYEYTHDPSGEITSNDRDTLSARLNDAFAAGDVNLDDYQARLAALFSAQKRADLVPILAGLPGQYRSNEPALGGDQPGKPGEVAPLSQAPKTLLRFAAGGVGLLLVLIILLVIIL